MELNENQEKQGQQPLRSFTPNPPPKSLTFGVNSSPLPPPLRQPSPPPRLGHVSPDAPPLPPPRPSRHQSPKSRVAIKFARSPIVSPLNSLKNSYDSALAQQQPPLRPETPTLLPPPGTPLSSRNNSLPPPLPKHNHQNLHNSAGIEIVTLEYESYLNKDENKDFGKGEGGGDEGGKDEEGESSDSDNCTSDMEMFSYGCPACGAEEVSDYINCIVCASIGCIYCITEQICIACEKKEHRDTSPNPSSSFSFSSSSSPSPITPSRISPTTPTFSSPSHSILPPPPMSPPPPLPALSPVPTNLLLSSSRGVGEDEEINRDVTAQRIKEQLDLIEGDKMQLENLKKQMRAVERNMMMREVEISHLEWQRECCRFVPEFKIGHYKEYVGTRNWGLTEYESLKRVLDSLKSLFVEERVDSQDHSNVVEICKSTHKILTSLSARAFDIAMVCPHFDVAPGLKGNGWRSSLDVLESSLQAVLYDLKSKDKKWWRSIQRDTTTIIYIRTLENITSLAINVILKNSPMGSLFPVSNFEGMLNDLLALPLEVFYGKFFGAHFTKGLRRILGFLLVAMASFGDGVKSGEGIRGRIRAIMTSTKYLAFNKKAALRTVQLFGSGDINFLKAFWGLQETVAFVEIDTAIRTPTPSVNIVFKIKVEPLCVPNSKEGKETSLVDVVSMFLEHHKKHHAPKHYFQQEARNKREEELRQKSRQTKVSATCRVEFDKDLKNGVFTRVQVRLLSYVRHYGQLHSHEYDKISKGGTRDLESAPMMDSFRPRRNDSSVPEGSKGESTTLPLATGLLIHIHGGGFVAQTSKAHLNYLRDYAKAIQAPILSIDYSLAPDHPFPQPLYEAFFAYCWAISHPELLGTTAERVVLTGDSAGANLVIAVTMLAIKVGIRVPDVIVPVYPALLAKRIPSPARLLSVIDPLLGTGVLLQCLFCYSAGLEVSDEYMSPVLCSDKMFKKFPPVQLVTGKLDPLLDDSLLFASHLKRNNMPTILHLLEGLPHGFLGFNRVCREATSGTKVVIEHLKYAFNLRAKPPYRSIAELQEVAEQGQTELQMDFSDGKVGPLVVLGVFSTRETVTKEALENDSWVLEDMKHLGYVQLVGGKKYFVSHKISVDDRSFLFRVYQKKVKKSKITVLGFKNMKSGRFISQTHLTDTLTTANRMWDLESVDVRSPRWRIFKNGLTESTPFKLHKDKKTLGIGDGEPLFFKMIDVITATHSKVAW